MSQELLIYNLFLKISASLNNVYDSIYLAICHSLVSQVCEADFITFIDNLKRDAKLQDKEDSEELETLIKNIKILRIKCDIKKDNEEIVKDLLKALSIVEEDSVVFLANKI